MSQSIFPAFVILAICCTTRPNPEQFASELESINLNRGGIALCGSTKDRFGAVDFRLSCADDVGKNFNLATALLHSFEYVEAEKIFARVIDDDPECIMAYWGVAMCNFHPLWTPPNPSELEKGSKIIALARSVVTDISTRESDYLETIATIYDHWRTRDHHTRLLEFETASERLSEKYPDDNEAAIFYALALDAAADPADKSFYKQKKAGKILETIFTKEPDHPGITHYIIHNYDYPELAVLGLSAARTYASIAASSAHAQHMPSHIFTRLGLWEESIQSNLNSVASAQCYAEGSGIKGHWDEELHGMDYLIYAYLQTANDKDASAQMEYLKTITEVFPVNFKVAYSFAAMPARYALERKDWNAAAKLELSPANFPWDTFLWEKANVNFGRILGMVHLNQLDCARNELKQMESIQAKLMEAKEAYKANLVNIQIKASSAWIKLAEGKKTEAIELMKDAAAMEDATSKHPVTPGEIIPSRELLGDMFLDAGDPENAAKAYTENLRKHPNRFNGLYGAGLAAERLGNKSKAKAYYEQLLASTNSLSSNRPQIAVIKTFLNKNN